MNNQIPDSWRAISKVLSAKRPAVKRIRITADVTAAQRQALQRHAQQEGFGSWSEYCRWLADYCIELDKGE